MLSNQHLKTLEKSNASLLSIKGQRGVWQRVSSRLSTQLLLENRQRFSCLGRQSSRSLRQKASGAKFLLNIWQELLEVANLFSRTRRICFALQKVHSKFEKRNKESKSFETYFVSWQLRSSINQAQFCSTRTSSLEE